MHLRKLILATASLAASLARADFDLDSDDIPSQCRDVCDPVRRLGDICDVDDDPFDDRTEALLEAQCYCTNDSFNVSRVTAQCASCLHEHDDDDDDARDGRGHGPGCFIPLLSMCLLTPLDVDDIMRRCGFSSTSYNEADIATVTNVDVQATRPTDADELTTTINGGAQSTQTGGGGGDNGGNGDGGNNNDGNTNNDGGDGDNAAPGFAPIGFGFGSLGVTIYVGVAAVAGAMLLS